MSKSENLTKIDMKEYIRLKTRIANLEANQMRAEFALEFYAYEGSYNWYYDEDGNVTEDVMEDGGERARKYFELRIRDE